MRGNLLPFFVLSITPILALSSLSPTLHIPVQSFPFCYWLSFPSCPSLLLFSPCLLPLPSPPGYGVKKEEDRMARIGEQRNIVGLVFLVSSFELSLHLNYADHKKGVAVSIHIALKLQDSSLVFFFFSIMKTLLDCRLCNYAH